MDMAQYDLLILDSFKARCLQEKLRHVRSVPFVKMRGFFSEPEFNRTPFSFHRIGQLLMADGADYLDRMMPHLASSPQQKVTAERLPISSGAVCLQ